MIKNNVNMLVFIIKNILMRIYFSASSGVPKREAKEARSCCV